jgi:hypothetical protein
MTLARWITFGLAAVVVAACTGQAAATPHRTLGPGEQWVPVAVWFDSSGRAEQLCAGGGFIGNIRLHGSATDPRLVWMTWPDNGRIELAWPVGYSARFTPQLELLDDSGHVVGREGTYVTGGCNIADTKVMAATLATPEP